MLDETATGAQIGDARPQIAVVGIGAVEQHGRHLPVGTDFLAVRELSRRIAAELDAWLLPAIPISLSECHGSLEGTVWLKSATLAAVVRDIARSVHAQGVRLLVVLNGHGGNFVLGPAIEQLNRELSGLRLIMPPEGLATVLGDTPIFETAHREVHAGEAETSSMLYYAPHLVRGERVDGPIAVGREFLDYTTLDRLNPEGTWGFPTRADAIKGERSVQARVRAVVAFVRQAWSALVTPTGQTPR
ncbi:MAG: creatininase family protein [Armatimonadota bacterium]